VRYSVAPTNTGRNKQIHFVLTQQRANRDLMKTHIKECRFCVQESVQPFKHYKMHEGNCHKQHIIETLFDIGQWWNIAKEKAWGRIWTQWRRKHLNFGLSDGTEMSV